MPAFQDMQALSRLQKCKLTMLLLLLAGLFMRQVTALASEAESLPMSEGSQFLQKLSDDAQSWADYSCTTEMHNFKPDKVTISHSHYYYRKGPEIRIEVIGGGFRDGSVIVKKRDGSIRARGGIWMGGIQMNLDQDSRMLILPSGLNATKADFPEVYLNIKEELKAGSSCKVSANPVLEESLKQKVIIMETYAPNREITRRVLLSPDQKYPLRWDSYKAGKLVMSTYFKGVKVNNGLKDDKFQL